MAELLITEIDGIGEAEYDQVNAETRRRHERRRRLAGRAHFTYGGHNRQGTHRHRDLGIARGSGSRNAETGCRDPEDRPPREADAGQLVQAQGPRHTGQSDIGRNGRSSRQGVFGDYSDNDLGPMPSPSPLGPDAAVCEALEAPGPGRTPGFGDGCSTSSSRRTSGDPYRSWTAALIR
jgi:hypothetical protein